WIYVEGEGKELAAQRFLIADATNPGGNLRQCIRGTGAAVHWRQTGNQFIRLQVNRILRAQQNRRDVEFPGFRELDGIVLEMPPALLQQKNEHRIPDINLIAGSDFTLRLHWDTIHQRAITTSQIANGELLAF